MEVIDTNLLFYVGLILVTGLLFGKLAKLFHLPNVTGYLVGGLIVGPIMTLIGLTVLPSAKLADLGMIKHVALGFIAFTIGTEFKISYFKRVGAKPIIIATFESLLAIIAVLIVLLLIGVETRFAIMLSSIAAATAPAATLMVIKQYKAKGDVTENLMSVVALDDATAIIFFGIMVAIASALGQENSNLVLTILKPVIEVILSLVIGTITGFVVSFLLRWFKGRSNRISVAVALIFITISLNKQFFAEVIRIPFLTELEFSTLLSCMMMGSIFTNMTKDEDFNIIMELVDRFTPPILILFFTISGAELNLSVLTTVGLIGVIYIVFRVVGKYFGAYFGAVISKSSKPVKKYLGWALVPQAGVAIGLTVVAESIVPEDAPQIKAVILCATLIYELVGPLITKTALKAAGEIKTEL